MTLSPFLKRLYVALSPIFAGLSSGGAVCYPTILLQQLKANTTTIAIDFETASWIGSIHGLAGMPSIFMPLLMQWKGRKFTLIFTYVIIMCGWILAYFAADVTFILLSESLHGFGTTSFLAVSCLNLTEMLSPKYRYNLMQVIYIIQTVGMAADGLFVKYYHWRTISGIMLVPMVISLIIACTIPEFPYWLAYKGNYSKCEENFLWLRGTDAASSKELNELTSKKIKKPHIFGVKSPHQILDTIVKKDFYVPALHICILQFLIYASGSIVTLIYSIEMLNKSIGNEEISSFGGFIMNTIFCIGVCIGMFLDRYFNTKPVLLSCVMCATGSLLVGSSFSYLQVIGLWPSKSLAGLYCLVSFMLFASIGIVGTSYSYATSLMPVKNRGLGGILIEINTCLFHALTLKSAPYMFLHLNIWGTYLVYSALSTVCGILIWKLVPEIKGRSLKDIENFYHCGSFLSKNESLDPLRSP